MNPAPPVTNTFIEGLWRTLWYLAQPHGGRSRVAPPRSPRLRTDSRCVKEGAHGGTMGSPVLRP